MLLAHACLRPRWRRRYHLRKQTWWCHFSTTGHQMRTGMTSPGSPALREIFQRRRHVCAPRINDQHGAPVANGSSINDVASFGCFSWALRNIDIVQQRLPYWLSGQLWVLRAQTAKLCSRTKRDGSVLAAGNFEDVRTISICAPRSG